MLKWQNGFWTEIGLTEAYSNSKLVHAQPNKSISLDPKVNRRLRVLTNLDGSRQMNGNNL